MRVLPVLDVMQGQVVRGIGGRRDEYRPIESPLCGDAAPATVAAALADRFGLTEAYVADLDAITSRVQPDWQSYEQIAAAGLRLWVDAGVSEESLAGQLANFQAVGLPLAAVIVALETLPSPIHLRKCLATVGAERLVFSLDLKAGEPLLSPSADWPAASPSAIAHEALAAGVRRMIVLDLADVGNRGGTGTVELCRELRRLDEHLEITAGGGVRNIDDLHRLSDTGCNAALVATALHEGRLTREEIQALQLKGGGGALR